MDHEEPVIAGAAAAATPEVGTIPCIDHPMDVESGDEDVILVRNESLDIGEAVVGGSSGLLEVGRVRTRSEGDSASEAGSCSSYGGGDQSLSSSRRGSRRMSRAELCEEIRRMAEGKQLSHFQVKYIVNYICNTSGN